MLVSPPTHYARHPEPGLNTRPFRGTADFSTLGLFRVTGDLELLRDLRQPTQAVALGQRVTVTAFPRKRVSAEELSVVIEEQITPFSKAVEVLCTIPGVQRRTAEVIIAETGGDMTAFPTAKHLASWAGICPGNDESAGKRRSGKTRKGSKWLRAN